MHFDLQVLTSLLYGSFPQTLLSAQTIEAGSDTNWSE